MQELAKAAIALARLIALPDLVIHCAGSASVAFSEAHPFEDFQRTVVSTGALLAWLRECAPAARLVLPSSAAVYGEVATLPIAETVPPRPASLYGSHKLASETLVTDYARMAGLRVVIVRFFSLYGPGLRKQLFWDACQKFSRGVTEFSGTGDELRDWLHVEDAGALIELAASKASPVAPVVNGGSGQGARVRDALAQLATAFAAQPTPHFSGLPRRGDPLAYVADIGVARAWGWAPRHSLLPGLVEYGNWYQSACG